MTFARADVSKKCCALDEKLCESYGDYPSIRFSCGVAVLKAFLVRRRTKTQKYKGALFEQLESGLGLILLAQLKTKQNRKQDSKTRHIDMYVCMYVCMYVSFATLKYFQAIIINIKNRYNTIL